MKAVSIIGIILIVLGVVCLAYFSSPIRFMIQDTVLPYHIDLMVPVGGGLSLVAGLALVFAARPAVAKSKGARD